MLLNGKALKENALILAPQRPGITWKWSKRESSSFHASTRMPGRKLPSGPSLKVHISGSPAVSSTKPPCSKYDLLFSDWKTECLLIQQRRTAALKPIWSKSYFEQAHISIEDPQLVAPELLLEGITLPIRNSPMRRQISHVHKLLLGWWQLIIFEAMLQGIWGSVWQVTALGRDCNISVNQAWITQIFELCFQRNACWIRPVRGLRHTQLLATELGLHRNSPYRCSRHDWLTFIIFSCFRRHSDGESRWIFWQYCSRKKERL